MLFKKEEIETGPQSWEGLFDKTGALDQAVSKLENYRKAHESAGLTIVFSDIEESTSLQSQLGNAGYTDVMGKIRETFRNCLQSFDAQEIETAGDSFLVAFIRPGDAVAFALRVQALLRAEGEKYSDKPRMRIGVHYGQVEVEEHNQGIKPVDLYGIQVTTASRIMSLGCGGQILCSRQVHDDTCAVWGDNPPAELGEVTWRTFGHYRLKGLRLPHEVIEVGESGKALFKRPKGSTEQKRILYSIVAVAGLLIILVCAALYAKSNIRQPDIADDSPVSLYESARTAQLKGDYLNARRFYSQLLENPLEYVDVHSLYASMLKAQDGYAAALQQYEQLAKTQDGISVKTVLASINENREQRIKVLEELAASHPEFGPVFYLLSLEYSEAKLGTQAMEDKREEKKYLDALLAAIKSGQFYKYFIDKSVAEEWIKDAEERNSALETITEEALAKPVNVQFESYGGNADGTGKKWNMKIMPADLINTAEIFYRFGDDGEFVSTGTTEMVQPTTGRKMPAIQVPYNPTPENSKIFIKCVDLKGREHGPYDFTFSAKKSEIDIAKLTISMGVQWIRVITDDKGKQVDFGAFPILPGSADEILYSFDSETLDQSLQVPSDRIAVVKGAMRIPVPDQAKSVSARIVWGDGEQSKTVKVDLGG